MPPQLFHIKTVKQVVFVLPEFIMWLQSDNGYTVMHMDGCSKLVLSGSIKTHMEKLKTLGRFVRVHRSYAINLNYLRKIIKGSHVLLLGDIEVPITGAGEQKLLGYFS